MQIIVLDGYTLNPGDLSWSEWEKFGKCKVYDRTPREKVLERAAPAEIVLTNKTPLDQETIRRLEKCRYIGVLATGYNVVDIQAAAARHIPVTNVPNYGTESVAQMTFALLLELTQHVGHHAQSVREGRWCSSPDWCYWDLPLIELDGKKLGIVGFGRIGNAVARIGRAFGMEILIHTRHPNEKSSGSGRFLPLEQILEQSDVVSLHCPLTEQTQHLMNAERIGRMKRTAYLLNTSRGPLIVEQALAEALNAEQIAGAGMDVLSNEPPAADNPLLTAKNCLITPHQAWATRNARSRLMEIALQNLSSFLEGRPQNVVNSP